MASTGFGREIFHLSTGFILEAKSHAQVDGKFVLKTDTGTLELPLDEVTQVEVLPDPELPKLAVLKAEEPALSPAELLRAAAVSQGDAPEFLRFVQSVARVESGNRTDAVSPKGAIGLMQLMPETARDLGVSAVDPRQNAEGGARYLRLLLERYGNDSVLALAAYNAGPAAVEKFGGVPPYAETQQYVRKVLREYAKSAASPLLSAPSTPTATK